MDGRTDGRTDGRIENIYSIFRDKLLLLGEHVYCGDDPDAFPLALICFYDKTNTDVFGSLSCAPFICTPSFLNQDCRNDDSNYMVLGYIPNLGFGNGKAKK